MGRTGGVDGKHGNGRKGAVRGLSGLAGLVATGLLLAVWGAAPVTTAPARQDGTVETASGAPAAGALVTATLRDGRRFTVYADRTGAFDLPDEAAEAVTVEARLPGIGYASVDVGGEMDGGTLRLRLGATDPVDPPGSAWLADLPEGEDTRRFILDCTGCHVTDGSRAEVGGVRRDSAAWYGAVAMMNGSFGPGTGFPIISSWAEPGRLAGWLERSFRAADPDPVHLRGPVDDDPDALLIEYPVPVPQDLPHDVMVDHEGIALVTGMFTHRMYRLDPATGAFDVTPIPETGANPRAVDVDERGRWWVVLGGPGKVGVYDPAGGEWTIHDVGMYAHSIAVGPDGRGWVNGHFTHDPELIAAVDHETGEVERFTIPEGSAASPDAPSSGKSAPADGESTIPYGLRVGPDGTVWGTQLRGNGLLRLDPATGAVRRWEMPVSHSGPRRPDVAPDGSIWIPLYSGDALARFDPETEEFRVWDFPVEGALPYVVRVDGRDGTVWIGTGHGDVVASFDPVREVFTLYPLPTRGALVRHLDVDEARGEVWFAYGASPGIPGAILRLRPGSAP